MALLHTLGCEGGVFCLEGTKPGSERTAWVPAPCLVGGAVGADTGLLAVGDPGGSTVHVQRADGARARRPRLH